MKRCSTCKVEKQLDQFYKEAHGAQGVKGKCKACTEKVRQVYKEKNAEKLSQASKAYHSLPHVLERRRNDPKRKEMKKSWYNSNKEKVLEYSRLYAVNHPEKLSSKRIQYKERKEARSRDRYKTDPVYKLTITLRNRLYKCMKGIRHHSSTVALLGCSIEEARSHLESLFQPGMTWGNMGEWHIDHILPCSMFNLEIESEQANCFHYRNLQPMWAKDNLAKHDKVDDDVNALTSVYLLFE